MLGNAGGTVSQTGGTVAATTFNNAGTFAQGAAGTLNAGTVTNAGSFTSAGAVTASGSFTNNGQLTSTSQITTPVFTNTGTVNGRLALAGLSTATNTASGTIAGGLAVAAAGGGATLANAGTIGSAGGLAVGLSGGTLAATNTGTLAGFATSAAGSTLGITNNALWSYSGTSALAGTDSIVNAGTLRFAAGSVVNGLETLTNTASGRTIVDGDLSGSIATVTNNGQPAAGPFATADAFFASAYSGGYVSLEGRSAVGIGQFVNNGILNAVPNLDRRGAATGFAATLGAANFTNGAAGVVNLVNNSPLDSLTLGGNYTGAAGSQIRLDVNLAPTAGQRADILRITGQYNGQSTLVLNRLDNPNTTLLLLDPVPVVVAGGGAGQVTLAAADPGQRLRDLRAGAERGGGNYQIVSRLNTSSAAGAVGLDLVADHLAQRRLLPVGLGLHRRAERRRQDDRNTLGATRLDRRT